MVGTQQGPLEKARLSQAQGQSPRQEPGLCFPGCATHPPAGSQEGWRCRQRKQPGRRGQQLWGPFLSICHEAGVGHGIALQDTPDPSCLPVGLVCKAATQSGAEGSLARAGMTGRETSFSQKKKRERKIPRAKKAALSFSGAADLNRVCSEDSPTRCDLEEGLGVGTAGPFLGLRLPQGQMAVCKELLDVRQTRVQVLALSAASSVALGVTKPLPLCVSYVPTSTADRLVKLRRLLPWLPPIPPSYDTLEFSREGPPLPCSQSLRSGKAPHLV